MTTSVARHVVTPLLLLLGAGAHAQSPALTDLGQSVADALRAAAGAEVALVPQAALSPGPRDLAAALLYPTDGLSTVSLTGQQLQSALNRSASSLPGSGPAFLFVSGVSYTYSLSRPAESRVVEVTVAGAALDPARKYRVVMPLSLAKGGQGYFKVWPQAAKEAVVGKSLEDVLKGKVLVEGQKPRGTAQG